MASTSNPPGCDINHYYANANIQLDGGGGGSLNDNVNPLAIYDFAGPSSAENLTETPNYLSLIHNPGISVEWAPEEQQVLEELLVRYAADTTFQRYSKIAHALHDKTIRDVAFRCRWMNEMQNRWKDHQSSSKNNEEKIAIATNVLSESYGAHSIIPSNTTLMPPINHDDRIDCTMTSSASGLLLQQNAYSLDQISASTDSIIYS